MASRTKCRSGYGQSQRWLDRRGNSVLSRSPVLVSHQGNMGLSQIAFRH